MEPGANPEVVIGEGWNLLTDAVEVVQAKVGVLEESARDHHDVLGTLEARILGLRSRVLEEENGRHETEEEIRSLIQEARNASSVVAQEAQGLADKVSAADSNVATLSGIIKAHVMSGGQPGGGPTTLDAGLEARIVALEAGLWQMNMGVGAGAGGSLNGSIGGVGGGMGGQGWSGQTGDLWAQMADQKAKVKALECRGRGEGAIIAGVSFGLYKDVKDFVVKHKVHYTGLFHDIVSLLERVDACGSSSSSEIKRRADLVKGGFHDDLDCAIVEASCHVTIPALFQSGGGSVGATRMNLINTPDKWEKDDGINGVARHIDNNLPGLIANLNEVAHRRFSKSPEVYGVVMKLLNDSRAFWVGLTSFVSSFHAELKAVSKGPTLEAWELITNMLYSLFTVISEGRSLGQTANLQSSKDPSTTAALAFYAALRANKVMNDIMKIGFRKHPSTLPSLTLYLYNHRAPTSMVEDLRTSVKSLLGEKAKMESALDKAVNRIKTLEMKKANAKK